MKLKITITGPKVHDVGYRYLLLGGAMGLRLPGFDASNLTDGKNQVVDIVVEGKEIQIKAFKEFVENNKPINAKISNITASEYDGDVMRIAEFSQVLTAMQMLKVIPTMLEIQKNTDLIPQIAENTKSVPQILEEIRGLREDIQPGFAMQFRQMQVDIRAIKERLGMP